MSAFDSAKEIRSFQLGTPGIETGVQAEVVDAEPTILNVGDPMPDADLFTSFLEQEKLSSGFDPARTRLAKKPADAPKVVLMNLKRLTLDAREKIRIAKSKFNAPVICMIPVDDADNIGLIASLGADDYVFKPFNPKEFACRVKVLLRRFAENNSIPSMERRSRMRRAEDRERVQDGAETNGVRVQIDNDKKLIWFDNRKIALTPKEYALFCLLASEPGRVFSTEEIIGHLWRNCRRATAANVQQYIYLLRKKIEADAQEPRWLVTIQGFGYKMNLAEG